MLTLATQPLSKGRLGSLPDSCSAAFERETAVNDHRKGRPVRKSRFWHNSFIGPRLHSNETGDQSRGILQSHSLTIQAQRFDTILLSAPQ